MSDKRLYSLGNIAIAERQTIHGSDFIVVHKPCWNLTEAALLRDWLNEALPRAAPETRTARRERTEEAAFNLGVLRTESPVEPGRGRKCCGCVDDEAYKFSECFCLCHTANNQG